MTRLWLHAGFHKTGTTAIQAFAAGNQRHLRRLGLFYPRYRRSLFRKDPAHHFLAHHAAGRAGSISASEAEGLLAQWERHAAALDSCVLLSAEPICRHLRGRSDSAEDEGTGHLAYLAYLSELLKNFEVVPVLVIRRQDDFVRSFYQEAVARGTSRSASMDFATFRRKIGAGRAQFLPVVERFEAVFGQVRVLVYEDLCVDGLVPSFFRELGLDLEAASQTVVRQSLSVRQTLIKRLLNPYIRDRAQNGRLIRWLSSSRIRSRLDCCIPEEPDLWRSTKERLRFLTSYQEENTLLCERLGFEREHLFPPFDSESASPAVPCPPVAELVQILMDLLALDRQGLRSAIGDQGMERLMDRPEVRP